MPPRPASASGGGSTEALSYRTVVKARLIDTSTGEIVWADEASVSVGGFGGGVDDDRMFAVVLKPALQQVVQKLAAVTR